MSWNPQRLGFTGKQPQPRGILRKSQKPVHHHQQQLSGYAESLVEKDEEELLVFGYACKIFPPDNHSRDIAKGRHLIHWNGDENLQLTIDRYDARASLHDLSDFGGDSWNTQNEISEEEARIEQLCDQERYMAMYTDIAEEKLRHEEELKRLHASIAGDDSSFKEVGFSYDDDASQSSQSVPNASSSQNQRDQTPADDAEDDQEEKPYMAHASLAIPQEMEIPPTEKMHAIIEKTAGFVSKQGTQMEIILKAKQANSSQFLFLDFDHYLNPYYKHVLQRIKEGKHVVGVVTSEQQKEEEESDSDDDGGYLHPSLFASAHKVNKEDEERKKETLKAIQKVDPNHPLAKLIEKGRKANALKQYNIMKSAVQNFNPGTENALEPPPLPKFTVDGERNSSSSPAQEQDALPASITPQEAAMVIVPPPPDIQPMVDSVAKQIAEEGDAIEQSMREKKDSLLAFLEPSHELHPYYTFRKTFIREQLKAQKRMLQQAQEAKEAEEKQRQSAPICFSIKGKENAPKTTLISTRLQALGDDSENSDDSGDGQENEGGSGEAGENKENEKSTDKASKQKDESKPSKRKFVEITVIEAVKPSIKDTSANSEATMSEEDRNRLLEQTKRKFTDAPPLVLPNPASMSTFTVVTPDGNTMSIAEFRERQAERRKKAAEQALQKAKEEAASAKPELPQPKNPATQDIFDIFEDEDSKTDKKLAPAVQENSTSRDSESPSKDESAAGERLQSPSLPSAPPALTLKDLVVAASRSSTPSSTKEGRRRRSRSRTPEPSRSRSRSRQSSPHRSSYNTHRRRSRSRSMDGDRDYIPSSYKKILGSSSYRSSGSRRNRHDDDENVPSAYKIENSPPVYRSNGNYSRSRRREQSPRHRSRKRRRHDSDKDEDKKKRKSHSSPSHKSKKRNSASKKKHKKKKSKAKKKKSKNHSSSEDGELPSDSDQSKSDAGRTLKSEKSNGRGSGSGAWDLADDDREEGELISKI